MIVMGVEPEVLTFEPDSPVTILLRGMTNNDVY